MYHSRKVILFDLNETLIHQIHPEQHRIADTWVVLAQHCRTVSFGAFEVAWNQVHTCCAQQYQEGYQLVVTGDYAAAKENLLEPWYRENIAAILKELRIHPSDHIVAELTWAYQKSWVEGLTMPAENPVVLEDLAASGCHLGLVTNFQQPDLIPGILKQFGLEKFFCPVVVSATVGYRKPHPDLFRLALSQCNLSEEPLCIAYVGDNPIDDVEGASFAGLCPILIDPDSKYTNIATRATHIRKLSDLPAILDGVSLSMPYILSDVQPLYTLS